MENAVHQLQQGFCKKSMLYNISITVEDSNRKRWFEESVEIATSVPNKPTVLYNPLECFNDHKRRILWHMKFKFEMPKGMFKEHSPILHLYVADGCSQYYNMKLNIFWLET